MMNSPIDTHKVRTPGSSFNAKKKYSGDHSVDMTRVAAIILGGGAGTRLYPLTMTRCKPAISFGGRYRLIDVPVSNAINSGCHKMFIITQFLSSTIHRHIFQTYHLDFFSSGFIEVLAAEQKPSQKEWFQGTADAVRQNIEYFIETPVDYFLILSGDQLYNFDFRHMVQFAEKTDADLVVAALPVNAKEAKRMGILKVNEHDIISDFYEKPQDPAVLEMYRSHPSVIGKLDVLPDSDRQYLGSMGIYLFKRNALIKLLQEDAREDFGKHLIPTKVKQGGAFAYLYDGYWEDIGTIEAFYQSNIALTQGYSPFDFYNETNPIYSNRSSLPGPKICNTRINHSIICEGALVEAEEVGNSILGPRSVVKRGTVIMDSYIMGNDFYKPPVEGTKSFPAELHIGENCVIRRAILDKNVFLGKGVQLINKDRLHEYDSNPVFIRDGIIVVTRGAHLPDGFIL